MEKETTSASPGRSPGQTFRILRPLLWWLLLVLVLYGVHTVERWLDKTRLSFTVSMAEPQPSDRSAGRSPDVGFLVSVEVDSVVKLDGKPVETGDRVSLGRHTLTVKCPKADPIETNWFVWFGTNDLGVIALKRSMGKLVVTANPPADKLSVRGPEFSVTYTNSTGLTSAVPTDDYTIQTRYRYWRSEDNAMVTADRTTTVAVAPPFGTIQLESPRTGVTFELRDASRNRIEAGTLPVTLSGLPAGGYRLATDYRDDRREFDLQVTAGKTNTFQADYRYGAARLESQPPGATVRDADGRRLGITPLELAELRPGRWEFALELDKFVPVQVGLGIEPGVTNQVQTNLVNRVYRDAMERGRQALAATNLTLAVAAAEEAERAQPEDGAARALQAQAWRQAVDAAIQAGDKTTALQRLDRLIQLQPADASAGQQRADLQKELQAESEAKRQQEAVVARARRPAEYFTQRMRATKNSELFDQQELKVKGTLADVEAKLVRALTNGDPAFQLRAEERPDAETFYLEAFQPMKSAGWRRCNLVGGQTADGEVTLLFKVFEYSYVEAFSIRAWIGDNAEQNMVPIHPSRLEPTKLYLLKRRAEGISLIRGRIREASGD